PFASDKVLERCVHQLSLMAMSERLADLSDLHDRWPQDAGPSSRTCMHMRQRLRAGRRRRDSDRDCTITRYGDGHAADGLHAIRNSVAPPPRDCTKALTLLFLDGQTALAHGNLD